ncbi:hypothetical protein [Mucilaginibacter phyllosphaerae]|uniref:Bacteriocin n=1 Tax=Mucilaginibacter phyllosphaerae TaxID=1812349 RepID=A0A4Y8AGQ2_9SPHI|nr:hypothetical protein [Mucilaginibacter phyllosphaerae]MBB3968990.1 hypothetical protein [Mucilaginibacter phyllosphaerae]TEW67391.1 hypothetical protein E2R65_05215 [Mucilaginibacter phyllosphaerae]GGH23086.1 hypothetical protein GCM10007352_36820 [Mucilaginibacter phyllosphaerae]
MKKLKELGKALTRKEMKFVNGGYAQCVEGYVCGPSCPDPNGPYTISKGWACTSPGGACKPVECVYN